MSASVNSLGVALDHEGQVAGAHVDQVHVALRHLFVGGVDHELPIDPAHAHRADGALEWGGGQGQRCAGGIDAENIGEFNAVRAES